MHVNLHYGSRVYFKIPSHFHYLHICTGPLVDFIIFPPSISAVMLQYDFLQRTQEHFREDDNEFFLFVYHLIFCVRV